MPVGPRRQSRSVAFLYGGIAGPLLMVIATVALLVSPPSPPSVAEYAPGAIDAIEDAPEGQLSQYGLGDGDCPSGVVCTPGQRTEDGAARGPSREIVKARVRRCVGNPPRQTEDPQSPLCVNYWEGDNGGATHRGVTRDEIRLGFTRQSVDHYESTVRSMVAHFNRRYEFYGRQITLHAFEMVSCCPTERQQEAAVRMDEELGVFAALSPFGRGGNSVYVSELARRGIISFQSGLALETSSDIAHYKPYFWAFSPAIDLSQRNLAEFYCKSLHARPAGYGGADLRASPRKLAIVQRERPEGPADASPLQEGLRRCGAGPVREVEFVRQTGATDMRNNFIALEMKNDGITTVFCICDGVGEWRGISGAMDDVGYYPEVLLGGLSAIEVPHLQQREGYRNRMFGLSSKSKNLRIHDEPWYQAVKESDPNSNVDRSPELKGIFDELRILASGIQSAGPRLTPQTFEQGLFKTVFPNPNSAAAPYWQAGGAFQRDDYTFTEDYALIYWSDSAESRSGSNPVGDFCYVDHGQRWSLNTWPDREHAFFDATDSCR